jgi:hypothetical protein
MRVSSQTKEKIPRVRVELDGASVVLPEQMDSSLVAIRAYLEFLALQKRRVLSGFLVDGIDVRQVRAKDETNHGFQTVQADTITFEQLSFRLVDTACRQLHKLSEEMGDAVLRVLITDRDPIHRQWRSWVPQFRNPLVSLGFLRELWGGQVDDVKIGGLTLMDHLDDLNPLLCEVDVIFLATEHEWVDEDAMAISALLEDQLVPWLKMLEVYLLKLNTLPLE